MKNRSRNKHSKIEKIVLICLIGILALVVVFGLIAKMDDKAGNNPFTDDEFSYSDYAGDQIYYESEWYVPNDSIESILILGIDKKEGGSNDRQNSEQADFLALVVMNKDDETYQILHLNRDTMTDIPQTDAFGEVYGYVEGQLTLAHTYGNDDKIRCRNTENTVEKLLYGIDIDHYLSLTMDAVAILNDSIGGVTVQLMDDFTDLDETFVKDAVVTLKGEQALAYVQARGSLEDNTNLHRMERQQQYIAALIEKLRGYDFENTVDTMMEVNEYLVSDCTVDQLSRLIERLGSYTYEGTVSPEGEAVKGAEFMEYHVDDQALQALVVEMFYELRD